LHRATVRALARGAVDPAHAQSQGAVRANVDGDLGGRAAHPAGLDLHLRLNVGQRALPHLHRGGLGLLGDAVERAADGALGARLRARRHDRVDEPRHAPAGVDGLIRELGIGKRLAFGNFTLTWHYLGPLLWSLGAVLGTALTTVAHARRVERAADDVIANAG